MPPPRATKRPAASDPCRAAATPRPATTDAHGPRRRTVLASLAVGTLALVTGCDLGRGADTDSEGTSDPDLALLRRVGESTSTLLARVQGLDPSEQPDWAAVPLATLAACLTAHLSELDPEGTLTPASPSSTPDPTPSPSAAATALPAPTVAGLRAETEIHLTLLTDAAGQAESGAFARLLASAAAGLTQHLSPAGAPGSGRREDEENQP